MILIEEYLSNRINYMKCHKMNNRSNIANIEYLRAVTIEGTLPWKLRYLDVYAEYLETGSLQETDHRRR
jgi:hypothetical protein